MFHPICGKQLNPVERSGYSNSMAVGVVLTRTTDAWHSAHSALPYSQIRRASMTTNSSFEPSAQPGLGIKKMPLELRSRVNPGVSVPIRFPYFHGRLDGCAGRNAFRRSFVIGCEGSVPRLTGRLGTQTTVPRLVSGGLWSLSRNALAANAVPGSQIRGSQADLRSHGSYRSLPVSL